MKYLYIVSSPHGGSTLLSHILGRLPQAVNLGEVSFMPKDLALGGLCTCGRKLSECAAWADIFNAVAVRFGVDLRVAPYDLSFDDAVAGKFASVPFDPAYQTAWRRLSAKFRGAADMAALLGAPYRQLLPVLTPPSVSQGVRNTIGLYQTAAQVRRRELVIDASKLPRKAPRLYLQEPDKVRILHMVRDGRGVLASRMKYMSPHRAASRWNHYHRVTRHLLRRWIAPEARMQLRYEDFVADPEQHLKSLCAWLNVDYSSEMLDASDRDEHSAGGNPARFSFKDGIQPADERWRTKLSADQLEMFDRVAGALNRDFGYD